MARVGPPQVPVAVGLRSEVGVHSGAAGRQVQPAAGPFERAEGTLRTIARMVLVGLAQHAAYLAHEGRRPDVVSGDVPDGERERARAGRARGRARCLRQGVGVVPVAADHVVLRGRPVQGGQLQTGYVGEVGEHGQLKPAGDGDALVEVEGPLDGLGGVAGQRGQYRTFVHADAVRGVPPQDQGPEDAVRTAQGQTGGGDEAEGGERRRGRGAGHGIGAALLRRPVDHDHPVLAHRSRDRPVRSEGEGLGAPAPGRFAVERTHDGVEHPVPHQNQVDAGRLEVPADQVPDPLADVVQAAGVGEVLGRPQEQFGAVEQRVHPDRLALRSLGRVLRSLGRVLGRLRRVLRGLARLADRRGAHPHPHLRTARRGEVRQVPQVVLPHARRSWSVTARTPSNSPEPPTRGTPAKAKAPLSSAACCRNRGRPSSATRRQQATTAGSGLVPIGQHSDTAPAVSPAGFTHTSPSGAASRRVASRANRFNPLPLLPGSTGPNPHVRCLPC